MCDLRTEEGLAQARDIALAADVVVENFRPGVMQRFGLDYETLRAERPDLVYCSITGFGSKGGAHLPGYDLLVQAVGGLMSVTGSPESEPSKVGVALVDVVTGQNAVVGILAALRSRDQTGRGQRVEVNLLSSLLAGLVNQASSTLATGESPQRMGNAHPSIAPYETLRTADGPLALAVGTDKQFAALARVLGVPGLSEDSRFRGNSNRVAHRVELKALLEEQLRNKAGGGMVGTPERGGRTRRQGQLHRGSDPAGRRPGAGTRGGDRGRVQPPDLPTGGQPHPALGNTRLLPAAAAAARRTQRRDFRGAEHRPPSTPHPPESRTMTDTSDLIGIDTLLTADELALRETRPRPSWTVRDQAEHRRLVRGRRTSRWRSSRRWPSSGLLGMHLKGYGCAGRSAVDYGLAGAGTGGRGLGPADLRLASRARWR